MNRRDRPINYLHRLASHDTYILCAGGSVDYFIFHPDGRAEKWVLRRNRAAGERPGAAVPERRRKALRLHHGASYALMAHALSPERTADRVKIGAGENWRGRGPAEALHRCSAVGHQEKVAGDDWAEPKTLRPARGENA